MSEAQLERRKVLIPRQALTTLSKFTLADNEL